MTDNLFRPSKEMREYDALRANAEKAELLRAAETLKKYCETTRKNRPYHNDYGTSCTKGCMFALACDSCPRSISNFMDKLIYGIEHHD